MKNISIDVNTIEILDRILAIDPCLHGKSYLVAIAKNIYKELGFEYIFFGCAIKPENTIIQTVVSVIKGEVGENFHYELENTPCENVFSGRRVCIYTANVSQSFPNDYMLVDFGVNSYIGAPIIIDGHLFGLVALLDSNNLHNSPLYNALIEFISSRVSIDLERHVNKEELEKLVAYATTDPLTGLLNRREFINVINHVRVMSQPSAALFIDVDDFKNINDKYGHVKGDDVLIMLAETLSTSIRGGDIISRFGGEEFAIFLPKADKHIAIDIANRIHLNLKENSVHPVTVSIGLSFGKPDDEIDKIIQRADDAMYLAKRKGKNQSQYL